MGQVVPIVVFIHIPKTAGSTLRLIAKEQYGEDHILPIYGKNITHARKIAGSADLTNIRMITGHISYGVDEVVSEPCVYMTVLRHPLPRLLSLYNYIHRDHSHPIYAEVMRMSFREYVLSGIAPENENGQVRQLCGWDGEIPQEPWGVANTKFGGVSIADLQMAIYHVAACTVVGIMEDFPLTLQRLHDHLGWKIPKKVPRANTSRGGVKIEDLTESVAEEVTDFNRLDVWLWQYAREKLIGGLRWP